MKIRTEVEWFARLMEDVLSQNDYKTGWEDIRIEFLLRHLFKEVEELSSEVALPVMLQTVKPDTKENIIKECTDIANFAMMIADNVNKWEVRINED